MPAIGRNPRRFLAGGLLLAAAFHAGAAGFGKPAPDVALRAADGSQQNLAALQGKVVYVDFWASWCGPCRQSFPWMNALQQKFNGQGLVVLAINLDAKSADADAFLARYPAKFRLAFDSEGVSAKVFGVRAMPTSFVIGRDGTLLWEHRGFREAQTDAVEAEIREALKK